MDSQAQPEPIETLVYISSATQEMSCVGLHALLTKARANNRAADITGVLLYAEHSFIQVLEGAPDALDATFARIQNDPRHKNVLTLVREPIETRSFSRWTLGYRGCEETFEDIFDLSRASIETLVEKGEAHKTLILLRSFFNSCYPRLSA